MKTNWLIWSFVSLATVALAQSTSTRKLARVAPEQRKEVPPPGLDEWKKQLSDADLERREAAFSELVERARGDEALRQSLEQASKSDAGELAWTARLVLRELRNAPRADPFGRAQGYDDLRRRFEELERNFGGMDSMFEDLRSHLVPVPQAPGANRQLQVYSLQVGPDGVTLETTEEVDGNTQKHTYKAKDMEELLQQNPQLRGTFGGGARFDFGFGGAPRLGPATPRPGKQLPTNVLGIYSEKLSPDQARELGLEPEQGLRVDRIEPGTIAQVLGIRRGDTLVELNGKPVYSAEDVRKVLAARQPDEDLAVTLIGEGSKERRTLRWSPGER
jgi:hypothetical protein